MTTLDKLQLCGIRSFGPFEDQLQQVKFSHPLTLFLGQNGCGKTTILESIKFAISGELPSGCKNGQGFLNDPKMSERAVTKGQIRLKMRNIEGTSYTIFRSMQVVQKVKTLSFSRLDATLRIQHPDGTINTLTCRCADLDNMCCHFMNVSPSILNNVILCHQENASWPLEEGQKLKERFDEIFNADKYNKCSKTMRELLKQKQIEFVRLKDKVQAGVERKERADKLRDKLEDKKEELSNCEAQIEAKQEEQLPMQEQLQKIYDLENMIGALQQRLAAKEEALKGIRDVQNTLKKNIHEELDASENEIRQMIRNFDENKNKTEQKLQELDKKRHEITDVEKRVQTSLQKLQIRLGQLRESKKQCEDKCSERNALVAKAKILFNYEGATNCDTPEATAALLEDLKNLVTATETALADLRREKEKEEANLQAEIDRTRDKYVAAKESLKSNKNAARERGQKIIELKNRIHELEVSDDRLRNIGNKLEDLRNQLKRLDECNIEGNLENKIENSKEQIQSLEKKLKDLENLYKIQQQNYIIEEKLDSENQLVVQRQSEVKKLHNKHGEKFEHLFNENIPRDNLKLSIKNILDKNDSIVKTLNNQIINKQKQVLTFEAQTKMQIEKIASAEKELEQNLRKLNEVCEGKKYDQLVRETYEKKEKLQRDKGQYSSAKIMYETFIGEFEGEKPCCPVCKTNFNGKNEMIADIVNTLKRKIVRIPEKLTNVEENLKATEDFYNKLQQLGPIVDDVNLLQEARIPLLKEEFETTKERLTSAMGELDGLKEEIKGPQAKLEICRSLISDAALMDQYQADVKRSEANIGELRGQLTPVQGTKVKEETEEEIETVKVDLGRIRIELDTERQKLDNHKSRRQKIREEINKYMEQQMQLQNRAGSRPQLEEEIKEREMEIEMMKVEAAELESQVRSLESELSLAQARKRDIVLENNKAVEVQMKKVAGNKKLFDDIYRISNEINEYLGKNIEGEINRSLDELSDKKKEETELSEAKTRVIDEMSDLKQNLGKQGSIFRNLNDNLLLLEKKKVEEKINAEVVKLREEIGNHNFATVAKEKRAIEANYSSIEREVNNLKGQESELSKTIRELTRELELPEHKNARKDHLTSVYEEKLMGSVISDLSTYINVLDKSIIEFHKERMVQINARIRELWRTIYRGNDIDYVEIKTEEGSSSGKRRSYNYKVVQVKRGVELEMRGRCSAGQRVLACLVIRMALAETFSAKCGILVLDEPTTNLDRENIESLGDTLADIVSSRREQSNFQLIVVTHDEGFLNALRNIENMSHYWKVSRNEDGYSIIQRENM